MSTTTHQGAVGAETMTAGQFSFTNTELREIREAIRELGEGAIRTQKITDHQAASDLQRHCIQRIERALASRASPAPRTDGGMTAGEGISLAALQAAHVAHQAEWCPDQLPDLSFRGNELAGEAGETSEALILHAAEISKLAGRASNIVKKLERERHGWRGSRATKADLAAELADLIHCAVLCAITADIDAGQAVIEKFNATSEKQGLSVFLPMPATPAQPAGAVREALEAKIQDVLQEEIGLVLYREEPEIEGFSDAAKKIVSLLATRLVGAVPDSLRATPNGAIHNGREHLRRLGLYGFTANDGHHLNNCEDYIGAQQCFEVMAEALLATHPAGQSEGEAEPCGICDKPLIAGQRVMQDVELGTVHAACCGPEREAYVKDVETGEPLGPNELIPQGYVYDPGHPAGQSAGSGAEAMRVKAAEVARNNAAVSGDGELYIAHKIADEIEALPLPATDSTRTGDEEAAKSMAVSRDLDWSEMPEKADLSWQPASAGKAFWRELARIALAARPAAPEAQ